jgi:hypothetical protein
VSVEEYNRRGIDALERAQKARGIRSAEAFARLLALRTGGSPDGSTYRRWLRGDGVVPVWALVAAAEEADSSFDALLGSTDVTPSHQDVQQLRQLVGLLQAQMIEVRERLGMPWQTGGVAAEEEDTSEAATETS